MASMVEFIANVAGVMRSFFQIGGPASPGINANGAALETKNSTNTAFAIMRGATPVNPNDFSTKQYNDTTFSPIIASLQFNGNNPLPANSPVEQFYVVTTTGVNASIGQLVWDNGTGVGTAITITAPTGGEIVTTALFAGAITLQAFQNYVWNGAAWVNTATTVPGAVQVISFAVGLVTTSSVTSLPIGTTILSADLVVTTPYSAGAVITLGSTPLPGLLQAAGDNNPQFSNVYSAPQVTGWNAASAVVATIAGAPAAGASQVVIQYVLTANP